MEAKQKQGQVCSKCKKTIVENSQDFTNENHSNTKSDSKFICIDCKRKTNKYRIVLFGICAIAVLSVGAIFFISNSPKTISSFDDIGKQNDTINVEMKDVPQFNIANTTAVTAKMSVKGKTVEDIESFKRQVRDNISQSTDAKALQIEIPPIGILFNFDSNIISINNENFISLFADTYLRTNKKATILIEGYTCSIGDSPTNDALSQRRAAEINNRLLELGIPADKLEIIWYGKSRNAEFEYATISEYRRANISIK